MTILTRLDPDDVALIPALVVLADCLAPTTPARARATAERAWRLADADAVPASTRGQAALALARIRGDRALMVRARGWLRDAGAEAATPLREAEAWLAAHP